MNHFQTRIAVMAATILAGAASLLTAQTADTAALGSALVKPGMDDTQKTIVRIYGQFKNEKGLVIIKEPNDTILAIEKDAEKHCRGNKDKAHISMREKGVGVGGGYAMGIMAFGSGPIKDLAKRASVLAGRQFEFNSVDFEPMVVVGGFGYLGMGNGLRIGGGGMGGSRRFVSDRFSNDSAVSIKVSLSYGGFLIEKAIVSDHLKYYFGGYIGGGQAQATVDKIQGDTYNLLDHSQVQGSHYTVQSGFTCVELHAGCTYTLLPFFHVGASVSAPIFYSPEGFDLYTTEYVTVNPVLQLRFVFGNLG
jgi:hypothetical protein